MQMSKRRGKRISTLGARLTSMVSVALVLILLGLAALAGIAGTRLQNEVKRNIGFVVVMEKDCPQENINAMKTCLLSHRGVESITFASADEILASESEYMGQDIADIADGNPYSSEFDVKVRPEYASSDSIAVMSEFLTDIPGMAEINSESTVIDGIDSMVRRLTLVLTVIALVLLVVSIALIGNTVSLSVYGRRFIIHTMKLVGATPGFIRRPFVVAGLRDGFIAGVAAAALIAAVSYYAPRLDSAFSELIGRHDTICICLCLIIAGSAITSLTALVAANRYLRASYDEMFLK